MSELLTPVIVLAGMGTVFGAGLAYAYKVFAVESDERIGMVREVLPGANCGGCGFPGCDGFAAAVVEGKCEVNGCPVGGADVAKKIAGILGVEATEAEPSTARVKCNGCKSLSREKYEYYGITDCKAASQLFAGNKSCSYGCCGLGSCVEVCQFNAIRIVDGVAVIIEENCTACGKCVGACPKQIIELVPKAKQYTVLCKSQDKGAITKKNCDVGCIGCMKCTKVCEVGAITVKNGLAVIDHEKCNNCGMCLRVCPTSAIRKYECDGFQADDKYLHKQVKEEEAV